VQLPPTPAAGQTKTTAATHSPLLIELRLEILELRCTFHIC
jgi:hypothetical protein